MVSKSTMQTVEKAAQRYAEVEAVAMQQWQNHCDCEAPGRQIKCADCPYFREFVVEIQSQLHPEPEKVFASILPPKLYPPYSEEVKQQCIDLYRHHYSLQQIAKLTGAGNFRELRKILKKAGFVLANGEYSDHIKQRCLNLYRQGWTPLQIEEETEVCADTIRSWVVKEGISRPKNHYSDAQKQQAVSMYSQNKTYEEIQEQTGVPKSMVQKFARQAKARRKRVGRPPVHSAQVRLRCFELLQLGQSPAQIEEAMDVSADTVRKWRNEAEQSQSEQAGEGDSGTRSSQ